MKKLLFGTLFIAVLTLLVSSCGKYQDGPELSLLPKKFRLAGTWTVEKYVDVNGNETQDLINIEIKYEKDGTYSFKSNILSLNGTWKFDDTKENILTSYTISVLTFTDQVKILRLTNKELWVLDETSNTKTYYLKQ